MIYEIINPSDPVTIEADDLEVAQMACLLLGEGAYGLTDENEDEALPLLLFDSYDKWAEEHRFNATVILARRTNEVAACLRSAMCAEIRDRRAIRAAVGDDQAALGRYNDEKRSSLNDICGRAFALACTLEKPRKKVLVGSTPNGVERETRATAEDQRTS